MEILISMKADNLNRTVYQNLQMDLPSTQTNGYFIAEIREGEKDKLKLLKRYAELLEIKLTEMGEFSVEYTILGFKIKRKVNYDNEYMDEWEEWVKFSRELYEELEQFIDEQDT